MPKVVSNIQRQARCHWWLAPSASVVCRQLTRRPTGPATPKGRVHSALPAPEQVLELVRYENMLDRQLHRALTQLERRRSPKRVLQTSTDQPK